jgi:hypothetical protein
VVSGVTRKQASPGRVQAGPALVRQHFVETGQPPSDEDIRLLVDNVLIPMLRVTPDT